MVGTSNISSFMQTQVPADNKQQHRALSVYVSRRLCCVAPEGPATFI